MNGIHEVTGSIPVRSTILSYRQPKSRVRPLRRVGAARMRILP